MLLPITGEDCPGLTASIMSILSKYDIAQVEKVDLQQTIAVGDGANDLPMLSEAGLGITSIPDVFVDWVSSHPTLILRASYVFTYDARTVRLSTVMF